MGVRQAPTTKFMLPRTWVDVQVDGHVVPVKVGHDGHTITQVTPEFDVVARVAARTGRAELSVMAAAVTAAAAAGLVPGAPVAAVAGGS